MIVAGNLSASRWKNTCTKKIFDFRVESCAQPKIITDHLGSVRVTLTEAGAVDSWSDYYPFGKEARSSASVNKPREQFTGKERDAESGMDYFGARYYNTDVGRWLAVDPKGGAYPGLTPYNYVANNPLVLYDPDGKDIKMIFRKPHWNDYGHIILQVIDHETGKVTGNWSFGPSEDVGMVTLGLGIDVPGHQIDDTEGYLRGEEYEEETIETPVETDEALVQAIRDRKKENEPYDLHHNNCGQTASQLISSVGVPIKTKGSKLPKNTFANFKKAKADYQKAQKDKQKAKENEQTRKKKSQREWDTGDSVLDRFDAENQ